ncbi:MAG: hypothetical protein JWO06_3525, partial [Bacteroidota bacterium]|nr:hypothetical protein [Bacteroidota bacterium]
MKKLTPLFFVFVMLVIASCRKNEHANWNTELLVPIATSNMSLSNLVKDSALRTNADNSLTVAFNKTLYQFNLADQVVLFPDTSIGQKFTLDSLGLPNQTIIYNLSLGNLATNMEASSDLTVHYLGQLILGNIGQTLQIPGISGFSSSIYQFDGSAYFQKAILSRGDITIAVNNYYPVAIHDAIVEVSNAANQSLIFRDTIPYIPPGGSSWQNKSIAGDTIYGALNVKLVGLSTDPSNGPVLIDTGNYARLFISLANLRVSDAVAVFPSQDIVAVTQEVTTDIADRKLTYIDARRGKLHIYISSSVQQPLELTYILDGAYDKAGRPLKAYTAVPAAAPNSLSRIDSVLDIAGYAINLTGKDGSKFNTYTQTVIAHIASNGQTAHITLADSLHIQYEIKDVAPNYIKGYAGRDTVSANDSAEFAFLNMFKSGSIDLESVNMNLNIENGLGIDGQIVVNNLTAYSPINGSRTLTGPMVGKHLTVGRATDFPLTPANNNFALNSSNSNIKDLLGILPSKLYYNVQVKTNVNGNNRQYRDFAYLESNLKMNLNAEIPLSLIANHLVLKDTIAFDISNTNTNVNGISDGVINLIAENKYPIQANLTMVIYDSAWRAVDTLAMNQPISAGDLDNNCIVQQSKKSKIPEY